jgi:hypothetical protein
MIHPNRRFLFKMMAYGAPWALIANFIYVESSFPFPKSKLLQNGYGLFVPPQLPKSL